jgi:two-component sensor histidine kinase
MTSIIRIPFFSQTIILIVFSSFISISAYSQNRKKADSLLNLLNNESLKPKEEFRLIVSIAHSHPNMDTALRFSKMSFQLAQKINEPILQAEALEEISHLENKLGNIGKSISASFRALQIYESRDMSLRQASTYTQLANNYLSNQNYSSAISYLKKAKTIFENSNSDTKLAYTILNLGEVYRLSSHDDSAKTSFKNVLKLNEIIKSDIAESYSLGNLGMVYSTQDSLEMAKTNLQEAIDILRELKDSYATSVYLAELGEVYQKENSPKQAEEKYLEAMTMAQEAGLKEQIRDFSEKLTQFYEQQGNYNKALAYQKLFQVYQDSLVNKANIQEIERLKAGYEIDKRESEIGLLSQANTNQKYFLWALGGGIFAAIALLWVLYKGNKRIKKANTALVAQKAVVSEREQEKALLLRELNHRVKNNLQMISSLLSLQSNELEGHPARDALMAGKDRVEALSLVHRKLYQDGAETRIGLKEYLEELVLGLFHGYQANFEPKLEITDVDVSVDTAIPLALIINEMVVNSLKYAYTGVKDPSFLLQMNEVDSHLTIEIMDNGKGFSEEVNQKENSFGLKLVRSLVEQLEGTLKKMEGDGTHWQVQLKVA